MRIFYLRYQILILLGLHMVMPSMLEAQVCTGNFGENIFTDGDFGSGTDNIVQQNPALASSYIYTTNPPPTDGEYTLTNNTALNFWPALWSTWIQIQDNSPDPNGYMMVVNSSFDPGVFYQKAINGICENTTYQFSADIINLIAQGVTDHIRPNVAFLIDGQVIFDTGEIPETNTWVTYATTFTTTPGASNVVLTLRNNAPGGIGNDLALDNISFRPCGPRATVEVEGDGRVCVDDPFSTITAIVDDPSAAAFVQWERSSDGGITWVEIPGASSFSFLHDIGSEGVYLYRMRMGRTADNLNNDNCVIFSDIAEIEVIPKEYFINDTICFGTSYSFGNQQLDISGNYNDFFISSSGCDSIVHLSLEVLPVNNLEADILASNPTCFDAGDGSIEVVDIQNAEPPILVEVNGVTVTDLPLFDLDEGNYLIRITDRYQCFYTENIRLSRPSPILVDAGGDLMVRLGEVVQIQGMVNQAVDQISWQPPEFFDCSVCLISEMLPLRSTFATLTVSNGNNCIARDSFRIQLDSRKSIYMPDLFTPNGDQTNDFLFVQSIEGQVARIRSFEVFDRWGGLVFSAQDFLPNDPSVSWDGSFQGEILRPGVFVYVVEAIFIDGREEVFSGSITLLR